MNNRTSIELENHVTRLTDYIQNDELLRVSADEYARSTLKEWGVEIPEDLWEFGPYWTLITEYNSSVVSRVMVQCSSYID